MPISGRIRNVCLCCASTAVKTESSIVSPFFAYRAWQGESIPTRIAFCTHCGFRLFDHDLSVDEATRYYRDYRNEDYFRDRRRFEPFYTRKAHRRIATWLNSVERRTALCSALDAAGAPNCFRATLDHGGSDGGLLTGIDADRKAVFDPSGSPTVAGVKSIADEATIHQEWDLVISCQVLEHVHDPGATLRRLHNVLTPGGWLYVEVPDEIWRNHSGHGHVRDAWLRWLLKHPRLVIAADTLSTACRITFGILPPMGFVPMRERLNYFTHEALKALVRNSDFSVLTAGVNAAGQIFVIARKSATPDQSASSERQARVARSNLIPYRIRGSQEQGSDTHNRL